MFGRHKHQYLAVQTFHYYFDITIAKTRILLVCQTCGKTKVKNVKGHWELKDIAASAANIEKELSRR